MSASVWKRELHLRRPKPRKAVPAPPAPEQEKLPAPPAKPGRRSRAHASLTVPVFPAESVAAEFAALAKSSPRIAKLLQEARSATSPAPAGTAALRLPALPLDPALDPAPIHATVV